MDFSRTCSRWRWRLSSSVIHLWIPYEAFLLQSMEHSMNSRLQVSPCTSILMLLLANYKISILVFRGFTLKVVVREWSYLFDTNHRNILNIFIIMYSSSKTLTFCYDIVVHLTVAQHNLFNFFSRFYSIMCIRIKSMESISLLELI